MLLTLTNEAEFLAILRDPETTALDRRRLAYLSGTLRKLGEPEPTPIDGVQFVNEFIVIADCMFGLLVVEVDDGNGYEALAYYRVPPVDGTSRHDAINLAIQRLRSHP